MGTQRRVLRFSSWDERLVDDIGEGAMSEKGHIAVARETLKPGSSKRKNAKPTRGLEPRTPSVAQYAHSLSCAPMKALPRCQAHKQPGGANAPPGPVRVGHVPALLARGHHQHPWNLSVVVGYTVR
jgi:hypothetical protein